MHSRMTARTLLPLVIFLALASLLSWHLIFNRSEQTDSISSKTAKQTRRDFRLKSLIQPEKELTPALFNGKITILNVWASWCGACRVEQDILLNLSKQSGMGSSLSWVGLNINDSIEEAQRMLEIYGNPYQEIIYDPEGRLAINFGIRGTPAFLILDQKGEVQYRHYGLINSTLWKEEILPVIQNLQEK